MNNYAAQKDLNIAIFAPSYPPSYLGGGPARTLEALARSAPSEHRVLVLAPNRDTGQAARLPVPSDAWSHREGQQVYYCSTDSYRHLLRGFRSVQRRSPDVIYLNSFFNARMSILPQLLALVGFWRGASVLLAPRGELDSGALELKSGKKRAYILFYKLLGLHKRLVWHASADFEAAAIRRVMGSTSRILVRENETSLPIRATAPVFPFGRFKAVYVGRITPKKGLLIALEGLCNTSAELILDIYGPEEDQNYAVRCREAVSRMSPGVSVRFLGPLQPDVVRSTFQSYDAFLFPTMGENFGHVIAESLSAACPVVCAPTTPWTARIAAGAGMVVSPNDASSWRRAIERLASLTLTERFELRTAAGNAYNEWRAAPKGPHVFTLLSAVPQ